jgi:hypothetical protein
MIQQSGPGLDGKKGDVALAKAIEEDEVESIIQERADDKTHQQQLEEHERQMEIEYAANEDSQHDLSILKAIGQEETEIAVQKAEKMRMKKEEPVYLDEQEPIMKKKEKTLMARSTLHSILSDAEMDDTLKEVEVNNRPPSSSLLQIAAEVES